jgi:hypothetical protein
MISAEKKKTLAIFKTLILCLFFTFSTTSCGVYSFSGVNISPDIKTVSIANFFNDSGNGPANLGQRFTEDLKDYFQQNTNLTLKNTEGDIRFDGNVVRYVTTPIAPTASSSGNQLPTSNLTRLTIGVKVNYVNTKDEKANFSQEFSFYADFPREQPLSSVENTLIDQIHEQIVLDIFNKALSNW